MINITEATKNLENDPRTEYNILELMELCDLNESVLNTKQLLECIKIINSFELLTRTVVVDNDGTISEYNSITDIPNELILDEFNISTIYRKIIKETL